jgi:hypothetical protein
VRVKPHLDIEQDGAKYNVSYHKPETILPAVTSKAKLMAALEHYANPFIKLRTPDSVFARRHYVERVRPALRWFCKIYHVNVPSWLEGNAHYDEIPPEEHKDLFGDKPLKVREFEEWETQPHDADAEGPNANPVG